MSEYMGNIRGQYEAKPTGYVATVKSAMAP